MKNTNQTIGEAASTYNVQYVDWDFEQMRGRCSVRYCAAKKYNRTIIGRYLDSDDISVDSCKFKIKLNKKERRAEITVWNSDKDVDSKLKKGFESFSELYHDCCYSGENEHEFFDINMFSLIRNVLDFDGWCAIPNHNLECYVSLDRIQIGDKDHEYWIEFDDLMAGDDEERGYLGVFESILANKQGEGDE